MLYIQNPNNKKCHLVRALLDSGANTSLITEKVFKKLQLKGNKTNLQLNITGDTVTNAVSYEVGVGLVSLDHSYELPVPFIAKTMQKIGAPFGPLHVQPADFHHLANIRFTERYPAKERDFDVLIAEPYYSFIQLPDQRKGHFHEPSAKKTKFGWVLRGAVSTVEKVDEIVEERKNDGDQGHAMSAQIEEAITFEVNQIYGKNTVNFDFSLFWSTENIGMYA